MPRGGRRAGADFAANRIARRDAKLRGEEPPPPHIAVLLAAERGAEAAPSSVCHRCQRRSHVMLTAEHLGDSEFCTSCHDALAAGWVIQASRAGVLDSRYRTVYGISLAEYGRLFVAQHGRCAICKLDQKDVTNGVLLVVDHDHKTGKVRGLLCASCNAAIGLLKESAASLAAAIVYLSRSTPET